MNKQKKIAIIVIIILVIILIVFFIMPKIKKSDDISSEKINLENEEEIQENIIQPEISEEKINIFNGDDRPIAFMIDNNKNAQPQASLNSTYLVYEIIVEGGETRLMAIFKGVNADEVGPIRSARHYFLDYALENDAIYCHLGMSPQADADFEKLNINHINGQEYDTGKERTEKSLYWRVKYKKAPHNAYTNVSSILEIAKRKGYATTSKEESVLNYKQNEVNLQQENAIIANKVKIPYTSSHIVEYEYDENTKRYTRYSKNREIKDETTGEAVTTKNIIITFAKNYTLDDGEDKGRQDVVTTGKLNGYYITNGKAIKITCEKNSRKEKTKYLDLEGNEIEVNDGNTWINICPIDVEVNLQ